MLTSIRTLIENNEIDKAKDIASEGWHDDVYNVLLEYPPEPTKCEECNNPIDYKLNQRFDWYIPVCEHCNIAKQKEELYKSIPDMMLKFGVPARFCDAKIEDFPPKYSKMVDLKNGAFLYGPVGTGKTRLMAAIMREMHLKTQVKIITDSPIPRQEHRVPYFRTVPELLLRIRASFNDSTEYSEQDIIEKYSGIDILFLDDMGVEKASEWVIQTLFLIIDRRYGAMKKTYISSNLSLDELADKFDNRIVSRIAEMCDVYKIDGKDRRIAR